MTATGRESSVFICNYGVDGCVASDKMLRPPRPPTPTSTGQWGGEGGDGRVCDLFLADSVDRAAAAHKPEVPEHDELHRTCACGQRERVLGRRVVVEPGHVVVGEPLLQILYSDAVRLDDPLAKSSDGVEVSCNLPEAWPSGCTGGRARFPQQRKSCLRGRCVGSGRWSSQRPPRPSR